MAYAVHEILLHRGTIWILLFDIASGEKAEVHTFLLDQLLRFLLPFLPAFPRAQASARSTQYAQDRVVNLLLAARKLSAHWNGARHVGVVIRVIGGDIQQ